MNCPSRPMGSLSEYDVSPTPQQRMEVKARENTYTEEEREKGRHTNTSTHKFLYRFIPGIKKRTYVIMYKDITGG